MTVPDSAAPQLSILDRLLPLFILVAMAVGIALSVWVPQTSELLNRVKISDVSLPIALGLLVMMYPPLALGVLSRILGERYKGREWFEHSFLPKVSPLAMIGLLYTIVVLFCLQGRQVLQHPWSVASVAVPLLAYFVLMFGISLFAARASGMNYAQSASTAFTAAGNNFELAIAVTIGTFGATSSEALAGTIGPMVEIPVLVALVYVMRAVGPRLFPADPTLPRASSAANTSV